MNMDGVRALLACILHFRNVISEILRESDTFECIYYGRLFVLNVSQRHLVDGSFGQLLHVVFHLRGVSNVIQGANKNVGPCSNSFIFCSCSPKVKGNVNV